MNKYLILSSFLFIFFIITTIFYPYVYTADFFDHTSAIAELKTNLLHPKDPLLKVDMQNPRLTPYTFMLALFPMDVLMTMKVAGMINLLIFLLSFYLFIKTMSKDEDLAFYGLIAMLFLWGFGWNISSGYNLKNLVFQLPYPPFICFSLSFLGLYCLQRYFRERRTGFYAVFVLITAFIMLTHFPTVMFLLLTSFMLSVFFSRKDLPLIFLAPMIAFTLSLLFPFYSLFDLMLTPKLSIPFTGFFIKTGLLFIVGIPIWLTRKRDFWWWGFLASFSMFAFFYISKIQFTERFFFYMAFYLQIMVADRYVKRKGLRLWARLGLAAALLVSVMFQFALVGSFYYKFNMSGTEEFGNRVDVAEFREISKIIKHYDVFISDPKTSFILPTFNGKAIGNYDAHINHMLPDTDARKKAISAFFEGDDAARKGIIERYNADYIVLNYKFTDRKFYDIVKDYGEVVYDSSAFKVIKVVRSPTGQQMS